MIPTHLDNVVRSKVTLRYYATNKNGDGLWVRKDKEWKQVVGTCDFTLRNVKDKKAKMLRAVSQYEKGWGLR